MEDISLVKVHRIHIKGTKEKAYVADLTFLVCKLTNTVKEKLRFESINVYITTRCLKHLYDSKPAEEYDVIIRSARYVIEYPDQVYENKNTGSKRGDLCFIKKVAGETYLCSIEKDIEANNLHVEKANFVATCFRLREDKKDQYLKNYRLLWSWKGGNPSS